MDCALCTVLAISRENRGSGSISHAQRKSVRSLEDHQTIDVTAATTPDEPVKHKRPVSTFCHSAAEIDNRAWSADIDATR
jgi:hypothetical protein